MNYIMGVLGSRLGPWPYRRGLPSCLIYGCVIDEGDFTVNITTTGDFNPKG
jgi:hypothetical protein